MYVLINQREATKLGKSWPTKFTGDTATVNGQPHRAMNVPKDAFKGRKGITVARKGFANRRMYVAFATPSPQVPLSVRIKKAKLNPSFEIELRRLASFRGLTRAQLLASLKGYAPEGLEHQLHASQKGKALAFAEYAKAQSKLMPEGILTPALKQKIGDIFDEMQRRVDIIAKSSKADFTAQQHAAAEQMQKPVTRRQTM